MVDYTVCRTSAKINGKVFYHSGGEIWGGEGQKQFQVLGDKFFAIDKKMQNVWVAPLVKSVNMLEKFDALIPPIIRQHYEDIVGGGSGYQGYHWAVSNIIDARWDWKVDVPYTT
jgi:hypothetical protein